MKRSRFTDQQIAFALQQAEQGTQLAEVTRNMGQLSYSLHFLRYLRDSHIILLLSKSPPPSNPQERRAPCG